MTPNPQLSVIIGTRNRPGLLARSVSSVLAGARVPDEIVIADQSDEPNPHLTTSPDSRVRYLWSRSRGVGRARNLGIVSSTGDVLAFIDDDVIVHANWLDGLLSQLQAAGEHTVVTGMVRCAGVPDNTTFAPSTQTGTQSQEWSGTVRRDVLYTGNMALFRSVLDTTGLFDERLGPGTVFPAAEDNDFGLRLLSAGFTIRYVPNAIVDHVTWRRASDRTRLLWNYGRGQGAYYAKHISFREIHMWRRFASDVVHSALPVLRRFWDAGARAQACFGAGVIAGGAHWMIVHRWREFLAR